jgi:hypothetical protein
MSLHRLLESVPLPTNPTDTGSPKAWGKIQERLGVPLPKDYKAFIDRYGTGSFNDWLIPYNPFTPIDHLNLFQVLDAHHQASRQTQKMSDFNWSPVSPFELYPAEEGLLPWGTTSNFNQALFWQTSGPSQAWSVVLYSLDNGEYEVWKMDTTTFLYRLLFKEIKSVLLPEGFPSEDSTVTFKVISGSFSIKDHL